MYAPQASAAGYMVGSAALGPAMVLNHWPWLILLAWIAVGVLIVTISHFRFSVGHRRFLHERRIAELQVVPGVTRPED